MCNWRAIGMAMTLLGLTAVPIWAEGNSGAGASNPSGPAATAQQFEGAPFWLDPGAARAAAARANAWNSMSACERSRLRAQGVSALPAEALDLGIFSVADAKREPLSFLGGLKDLFVVKRAYAQGVDCTCAEAPDSLCCCWIRATPSDGAVGIEGYYDCQSGDLVWEPPPGNYCAVQINCSEHDITQGPSSGPGGGGGGSEECNNQYNICISVCGCPCGEAQEPTPCQFPPLCSASINAEGGVGCTGACRQAAGVRVNAFNIRRTATLACLACACT